MTIAIEQTKKEKIFTTTIIIMIMLNVGFFSMKTVFADTPNLVYVSDNANSCIVKYQFTGVNSSLIMMENVTTGLYSPLGLVVNDNYVYVANAGNETIEIYDLDLNYIDTIGTYSKESDSTGFNVPRDIDVDSNYIYIADYNNYRIVIRDNSPPFNYITSYNVTSIGKPDSLDVIDNEIWVASYQNDSLGVVDRQTGTILEFARNANTSSNTKIDYYEGFVYASIDYWQDISVWNVSSFTCVDVYSFAFQNLGLDAFNEILCISDYANNRIRYYDLDGNYLNAYSDLDTVEPYDIIFIFGSLEPDYSWVIWAFWLVIFLSLISFMLYVKFNRRKR